MDFLAKKIQKTGIPVKAGKVTWVKNIDKLHRIGKTEKNNTQNTILKIKPHTFKERIYLKRKSITQIYIKSKLSVTKHQVELLKNANTLITDNLGTNFLYVNVHRTSFER